MIFTKEEYEFIHSRVFVEGYSGYKPSVKEIPGGDGNVDADKRYAHIGTWYFTRDAHWFELLPFLERAHAVAVQIAEAIELPKEWMPKISYGALRILEYPPGSISHPHNDFDLFTVMCYRDQPQQFFAHSYVNTDARARWVMEQMQAINPQAHLGELGEAIGLGRATRHEVLPSTEPQHSMVYFAVPDWETAMPNRGPKVKDWLNERMARSRTEFKKYE